MERRLLAARFESAEVEDVLTRLERVGLIDDVAFARQYAEHRFGARKEGSRGVEQGLRAAGIAPEKAFARLSSLLMRRGYSPEIARSAARKALEIAFQDE